MERTANITGNRECLLIVEDDQALATLISRILQKEGFLCRVCRFGEEALSFLGRRAPALLLLDYSLPDMTAGQLIKKMQHIGCRIPFVIMTGNGDEHIAVEMMKLGARDYLVKSPGVLELLLAVVTGVLAQEKMARELFQSRALLETAGRVARFGGWSVNLAENKMIWSDQVAAIHEMPPGYTPLTEEGLSFYAPEWQDKITRIFGECAREGRPYDEEMEIITARGKRVWVRTTAEAVRNESGTIIAVEGAFQDISERKQAEEALSRIEWMLSPDRHAGFAAITVETGNLIQLNTSRLILDSVGEEILKDIANDYMGLLETSTSIYEKNGDYALDILTSAWCRFLDSASRRFCPTDDNRAALQSGKWLCHESCWTDASKVAIDSGLPTDITCRGGIKVYAVPIRAGGEVVGSINFGYGDPPRDLNTLQRLAEKYAVDAAELAKAAEAYELRPHFITEIAKERLRASARLIGTLVEQKQTEKALQESERKFKDLVEQTSDLVWEVDCDGNYTYVNSRAKDLLGYEMDELLGKTPFDFVAAGEYGKVREQLEIAVLAKKPFLRLESVFTHKNSQSVVLERSGVPVYDDSGSLKGYRGISRDITDRKKTEEALQRSFENLQKTLEATVNVLAAAAEMRDPYTSGHQRRVADLACAIAGVMALPEEQIEEIRIAAILHDIGKINIPSEILCKPGKLSDLEMALLKNHPQVSCEIVKRIPFAGPIDCIVAQHHERMNGSGYPYGLSGEEILLGARILAVADVVEAMSSHRPYRSALGINAALQEISSNSGILYDSTVVENCLKLFSNKKFDFT